MPCQNLRPPTFFDPAAGQHSGIAEKLRTFFLPIFKKSRFDFRALKTPKIIFGGISIFGVIRPISVCRIEPQRFARRPVAQTSCVLFLLHTVFSTFRPSILSDFVESCRSSVFFVEWCRVKSLFFWGSRLIIVVAICYNIAVENVHVSRRRRAHTPSACGR